MRSRRRTDLHRSYGHVHALVSLAATAAWPDKKRDPAQTTDARQVSFIDIDRRECYQITVFVPANLKMFVCSYYSNNI